MLPDTSDHRGQKPPGVLSPEGPRPVLGGPVARGTAPGSGRSCYLSDRVQLLQDGLLILLSEASRQELVYLLREEKQR